MQESKVIKNKFSHIITNRDGEVIAYDGFSVGDIVNFKSFNKMINEFGTIELLDFDGQATIDVKYTFTEGMKILIENKLNQDEKINYRIENFTKYCDGFRLWLRVEGNAESTNPFLQSFSDRCLISTDMLELKSDTVERILLIDRNFSNELKDIV